MYVRLDASRASDYQRLAILGKTRGYYEEIVGVFEEIDFHGGQGRIHYAKDAADPSGGGLVIQQLQAVTHGIDPSSQFASGGTATVKIAEYLNDRLSFSGAALHFPPSQTFFPTPGALRHESLLLGSNWKAISGNCFARFIRVVVFGCANRTNDTHTHIYIYLCRKDFLSHVWGKPGNLTKLS